MSSKKGEQHWLLKLLINKAFEQLTQLTAYFLLTPTPFHNENSHNYGICIESNLYYALASFDHKLNLKAS